VSEAIRLYSGSLTFDLERQIDELCDEFEAQLKRETVPDVDEYLLRLPVSAHRRFLHEVTKLLREYSQRQMAVRGKRRDEQLPPKGTGEPPEIGATTRAFLDRSLQILQQIDDAGDRFEEAIAQGQLLLVEDMIRGVDSDARPRLLRELLRLEMEFRAKKGETPSLAAYRNRFPDQARLVKYLYLENFLPAQIGGFEIQRLLGRGGFGHVYQAWDPKLSRHVAIKVFRRDPADGLNRAGGLLFEARTAAQLRHASIVTVYAVLPDEDGDEFIVLEYVDGRSLEDLLRSRRLEPAEAAELVLEVVRALQHSHEHGLIHRDLKPANILLDQGRRPRVTDFGLALHLTDLRRSQDVGGTLPYMAPEQANGETHRLDARTDLWAVGVTLYRSLTGWLPFSGASHQELIEAIRYQEPKELLQHDASIPCELARIVKRCLAKRMGDRYQSADELVDDLTSYLSSSRIVGKRPLEQDDEQAAVIPKGLSSFDREDREFFLQLVPGPRDRRGVPESVRFWESRLRERDRSKTFRVGLLYGPSGSGKSSLLRAGVVPRLPGNVRTVIVEASRQGTEERIAQQLLQQLPEGQIPTGLADMLAVIREGRTMPPGDKLLLVIDQFEQWLHGWRPGGTQALIDALRQCDGARVQALVLVRDDFWMQATRFFRQLDIPLLDGFNAAAVDLFDKDHAVSVLGAFGVAYHRLSADRARWTIEHNRFLEQAVAGLSDDGLVVAVRLCIFAEMIKNRPWTPATLRDVGGRDRLGTAFLEEMFESRSASPARRMHRDAARAVLERLLPPSGSDIRGHLVSEHDLQVASGYAQHPAEFAELMRCLDQELRIVTPTAVEVNGTDSPDTVSPPSYQLTHDFLVSAIRAWLNQLRRRTLRGRSELRLAERAGEYCARSEARNLPSWWEWISIGLFTRWGRWKDPERAMMRAATRRHATRMGLLCVVVTLVIGLLYERVSSTRAEELVQALAMGDSRDVPVIANRLSGYSRWARPMLSAQLASSDAASGQHTRLLLGSLAVGDVRLEELYARLLDAEPFLSVAIADQMKHYGVLDSQFSRLQDSATNSSGPQAHERRLRALVALARIQSAKGIARWQGWGPEAADLLVKDLAIDPRYFDAWVNGLAPAKQWLVGPLCALSANNMTRPEERAVIAEVLVRYVDDPAQLVEMALNAHPRQLETFAKALQRSSNRVRPIVAAALSEGPFEGSEDEKDKLASRQANARLLLAHLGSDQHLWPALRHHPEPRVRSFLLHHLRTATMLPNWLDRLSRETDAGIRQAIVLAIGCKSNQTAGVDELPPPEVLLRIYNEDMDSGVHSAAEWALRQIGRSDLVEKALAELARIGRRPGFHWYVTPSRITMIIVDPPSEATLGSPPTEPDRDASDEAQWNCRFDRSFAISANEITQARFLELVPDYKEKLNETAPEPDCPVNAVTWTDALRFCRLLSEHDGISDSEMALPTADEMAKSKISVDLLKSGYRLPTEPEWEVACRAGTVTSRSYGYSPALLEHYACFASNAHGRSWRVGSGWPNAWGCFDMLGNMAEWCQNAYELVPTDRTINPRRPPGILALAYMTVRGNDFKSTSGAIRSANRRYDLALDGSSYSRGFRVAHTIKRLTGEPDTTATTH